MSDEPTKGVIYLGTVDLSDGEKTIALDLPLNADVETIRAAIEAAEEVKAAAARAETKRLRDMFLPEGEAKAGEEGKAT
jgi:hypothetical protein